MDKQEKCRDKMSAELVELLHEWTQHSLLSISPAINNLRFYRKMIAEKCNPFSQKLLHEIASQQDEDSLSVEYSGVSFFPSANEYKHLTKNQRASLHQPLYRLVRRYNIEWCGLNIWDKHQISASYPVFAGKALAELEKEYGLCSPTFCDFIQNRNNLQLASNEKGVFVLLVESQKKYDLLLNERKSISQRLAEAHSPFRVGDSVDFKNLISIEVGKHKSFFSVGTVNKIFGYDLAELLSNEDNCGYKFYGLEVELDKQKGLYYSFVNDIFFRPAHSILLLENHVFPSNPTCSVNDIKKRLAQVYES